MKTFRSLLAAAIVSSAVWPVLAAGPVDAAKALFDRGVEQLEAGHFNEACPAIEESYKLDPRPGTLFTLAECEGKWGRLATAVQRYDEYLKLYATLTPEKKQRQGTREKESKEARIALLPRVPEVTITLPPAAPQATRVTLDGAPVAEAALSVPMRVDPGEHVFTTEAPGRPVRETRVTVHKGEKKVARLEVSESAAGKEERVSDPAVGTSGRLAAPGDTAATPERPGPSLPVIVAGSAIAGAALAAGIGLLVSAGSKGASARETNAMIAAASRNCVAGSADPQCTGLQSTAALGDAFNRAGIGLLVGAGVVGVGTVAYALAPRLLAPAQGTGAVRVLPVLSPGLSALSLSGTF